MSQLLYPDETWELVAEHDIVPGVTFEFPIPEVDGDYDYLIEGVDIVPRNGIPVMHARLEISTNDGTSWNAGQYSEGASDKTSGTGDGNNHNGDTAEIVNYMAGNTFRPLWFCAHLINAGAIGKYTRFYCQSVYSSDNEASLTEYEV